MRWWQRRRKWDPETARAELNEALRALDEAHDIASWSRVLKVLSDDTLRGTRALGSQRVAEALVTLHEDAEHGGRFGLGQVSRACAARYGPEVLLDLPSSWCAENVGVREMGLVGPGSEVARTLLADGHAGTLRELQELALLLETT